ncbi:hypothetical protein RhiJN_08899 [Ceratobasidium sp. AG-Ba]|nr:hypothetical protein RhiJN_08899 [Ceratobasidium sp. AG-Ba]
MSHISISSDGTSSPPGSAPGSPAQVVPPPTILVVASPPPVPLSSPSPPPSTPETVIEFDQNLDRRITRNAPFSSRVARCPGCERTLTVRTVRRHRNNHCGALGSIQSNQVINCRGCGKAVTRWRARKHEFTGCDIDMRQERWESPMFRTKYFLWYNLMHSVDDYA